jgi:acarbose 7IV-phosphotransferase
MARVVVAGNLNLETTVAIDSFPIAYQPVRYTPFGIASRVAAVGYNVAKALTTLGDHVALVSMTGRDLPAATIRATLRADGIDDRWVLEQIDQTAAASGDGFLDHAALERLVNERR